MESLSASRLGVAMAHSSSSSAFVTSRPRLRSQSIARFLAATHAKHRSMPSGFRTALAWTPLAQHRQHFRPDRASLPDEGSASFEPLASGPRPMLWSSLRNYPPHSWQMTNARKCTLSEVNYTTIASRCGRLPEMPYTALPRNFLVVV